MRVLIAATAVAAITATAQHIDLDSHGIAYTKQVIVSPNEGAEPLVAYVDVDVRGAIGVEHLVEASYGVKLFCPQPVAPYEEDNWQRTELNLDVPVRFAVTVPGGHSNGLQGLTYQCWLDVKVEGHRGPASGCWRTYLRERLGVEIVYRRHATATANERYDDEKAWEEDD